MLQVQTLSSEEAKKRRLEKFGTGADAAPKGKVTRAAGRGRGAAGRGAAAAAAAAAASTAPVAESADPPAAGGGGAEDDSK